MTRSMSSKESEWDPATHEAVSAWIRNRRTVKPDAMDNRPVDRALIEQLLENANWAPSHGRTEPWRFHIYTGQARERLADGLQAVYRESTPEASFQTEKYEKLGRNPRLAPVVFLLVMERQTTEKIPEIEEIEAVACAVQNLHLSASAVGLGGFWSSPPLVYTEAMRNWLELGAKDRCLGLFYLGWPRDLRAWPEGRRKPIEQKVVWHDA